MIQAQPRQASLRDVPMRFSSLEKLRLTIEHDQLWLRLFPTHVQICPRPNHVLRIRTGILDRTPEHFINGQQGSEWLTSLGVSEADSKNLIMVAFLTLRGLGLGRTFQQMSFDLGRVCYPAIVRVNHDGRNGMRIAIVADRKSLVENTKIVATG